MAVCFADLATVNYTPMEYAPLDNQEVRLRILQLGTPANEEQTRHIVILGDEYKRELLIQIGPCEAVAILRRLEVDPEAMPNQPYAHDLLMAICDTMGATLDKVVIDDLWHKTYYAKLYFQMDGEVITIDARPSDAIALALRADAPMFASEAVMVAAEQSQQ